MAGAEAEGLAAEAQRGALKKVGAIRNRKQAYVATKLMCHALCACVCVSTHMNRKQVRVGGLMVPCMMKLP